MKNEDLLNKFEHYKVKFSSYYKYRFAFKSDDGKLEVYAGGTSEDIYRFTVLPEKDYSLSELPIFSVYFEEEKIYEAGLGNIMARRLK